jgi:hypothetical protein
VGLVLKTSIAAFVVVAAVVAMFVFVVFVASVIATAVFVLVAAVIRTVVFVVVTAVILMTLVARPVPAAIRRWRPVAGMPNGAWSFLIPVAIHPSIARTGARWSISDYRRRRRRGISVAETANSYSNRNVGFGEHRTTREQHQNQHSRFHNLCSSCGG